MDHEAILAVESCVAVAIAMRGFFHAMARTSAIAAWTLPGGTGTVPQQRGKPIR